MCPRGDVVTEIEFIFVLYAMLKSAELRVMIQEMSSESYSFWELEWNRNEAIKCRERSPEVRCLREKCIRVNFR